jgi:hypothetical protein
MVEDGGYGLLRGLHPAWPGLQDHVAAVQARRVGRPLPIRFDDGHAAVVVQVQLLA